MHQRHWKKGRKTLSLPIYTIGYGNRTIETFLSLLQAYHIQYVIDVRSAPYSRYNRDFSQAELQAHLEKHGIRYVFMGKELGGRPESPECYTSDGRVDYCKLADTPQYKVGIQRLHAAQPHQVCLMCSELRPQDCHRSKLIGETLRIEGIDVVHIDETGQLKTQQQTLGEFEQKQLGDLDAPDPLRVSRKSYRDKE